MTNLMAFLRRTMTLCLPMGLCLSISPQQTILPLHMAENKHIILYFAIVSSLNSRLLKTNANKSYIKTDIWKAGCLTRIQLFYSIGRNCKYIFYIKTNLPLPIMRS